MSYKGLAVIKSGGCEIVMCQTCRPVLYNNSKKVKTVICNIDNVNLWGINMKINSSHFYGGKISKGFEQKVAENWL